jgi:hypothetical protein
MTDEKNVIDFPRSEVSEEERVRRVMVEVDRLARLSPGEWKLWLKNSAQTLDIAPEMLRDLIETKVNDIKAAERAAEIEKRRQEDRAERQRREEIRKRERKDREKSKAFADIAKLPSGGTLRCAAIAASNSLTCSLVSCRRMIRTSAHRSGSQSHRSHRSGSQSHRSGSHRGGRKGECADVRI